MQKIISIALCFIFVFGSFGFVHSYGETYETLVASNSETASVNGVYVWNSGNDRYEHETEVYFIDEYAPDEFWINDGTDALFSSVGDLYNTTYFGFDVEGYPGNVDVDAGEAFSTPPEENGNFAGLGATLSIGGITGNMLDIFGEIWVLVALALGIPLAFWLILELMKVFHIRTAEESDRKNFNRKVRQIEKEHKREQRQRFKKF